VEQLKRCVRRLMRRVTLQGTAVEVSRLSFGTGSLHHLAASGPRQRLLEEALARGFTHFDTAPYYGFGLAEQELGRFARRVPSGVTVATKLGLYPPTAGRVSTAEVWLRKAGGKLFPRLSAPVRDWSLQAAARSLESSLRRLRLETIDLLLLHEPVAASIDADAFTDWLQRERGKGSIRAWGLAGEPIHIQSWLSSDHPLGMVLQVPGRPEHISCVTDCGRAPHLTYGYLSPSSQRSAESVRDVLRAAMRRIPDGSIIVSTRHLARLHELARIADAADDVR
jgi:hypothetical protein